MILPAARHTAANIIALLKMKGSITAALLYSIRNQTIFFDIFFILITEMNKALYKVPLRYPPGSS